MKTFKILAWLIAGLLALAGAVVLVRQLRQDSITVSTNGKPSATGNPHAESTGKTAGVLSCTPSNIVKATEATVKRATGLITEGINGVEDVVAGSTTSLIGNVKGLLNIQQDGDGKNTLPTADKSAISSAIDAGKAVGNGVVNAGETVGNSALDAGKAVGNGAIDAGKAIGKGAMDTSKAIGTGTKNALKKVGTLLNPNK